MKTAVELLAELLKLRHKEAYDDLYEDIETYYKKIEKEQIIDSHIHGHNASSSTIKKYDAEQYYKEIFNK
jgi:hypothetical protein